MNRYRVTTIALEQTVFENEVEAQNEKEAIKLAEKLTKEQKSTNAYINESYVDILANSTKEREKNEIKTKMDK